MANDPHEWYDISPMLARAFAQHKEALLDQRNVLGAIGVLRELASIDAGLPAEVANATAEFETYVSVKVDEAQQAVIRAVLALPPARDLLPCFHGRSAEILHLDETPCDNYALFAVHAENEPGEADTLACRQHLEDAVTMSISFGRGATNVRVFPIHPLPDAHYGNDQHPHEGFENFGGGRRRPASRGKKVDASDESGRE